MLWVFRDFPVIYILTGGGPQGTTQTLAIMTYREAFEFHDFGFAAAIGVITLIISVIASWFMITQQRRAALLTRPMQHYEDEAEHSRFILVCAGNQRSF